MSITIKPVFKVTITWKKTERKVLTDIIRELTSKGIKVEIIKSSESGGPKPLSVSEINPDEFSTTLLVRTGKEIKGGNLSALLKKLEKLINEQPSV